MVITDMSLSLITRVGNIKPNSCFDCKSPLGKGSHAMICLLHALHLLEMQ